MRPLPPAVQLLHELVDGAVSPHVRVVTAAAERRVHVQDVELRITNLKQTVLL